MAYAIAYRTLHELSRIGPCMLQFHQSPCASLSDPAAPRTVACKTLQSTLTLPHSRLYCSRTLFAVWTRSSPVEHRARSDIGHPSAVAYWPGLDVHPYLEVRCVYDDTIRIIYLSLSYFNK